MKQLLQRCMTVRLLGLMVTFFMVGALTVKAQTSSSFGGGSQFSGANSSNALMQVTKPKPVADSYPASSKTKERTFTKADGGDLIQVTHEGDNTNYQSWNDAVDALQENDVITLLQNVELVWGEGNEPEFKIPKVACTIKGTTTSTVFKSTSSIEMEAPVIFSNVTLDLKELLACGNKLVFDEDVICTNQYMTVCGGSGFYEEGVEIKSTSVTIKSGTFYTVYGGGFYAAVTGDTHIDVQGGAIGFLYGAGKSAEVAGSANVEIKGGTVDYVFAGGELQAATCGSTNLTIQGGTLGKTDQYRYNVMGGGEEAPVTDKAKVTISGGTFNCFVTAGGGQNDATTATCGSTELNITGGSFTKWTYGGGWASPVLGTATVKVSGTPILSTLCGGGARPTASCENTDVQISSDIDGWLCGGGEVGTISGTAKLTVTGGRIANNIYGGCTSAFCNRTEVTISGGEAGGAVYGGGEGNGSVVNEANLIVSGGTFGGVYGSGWTWITGNPQPNGYVKDVNMLITGGTIDYLSITPTITTDTPTPVTGKMFLTIEGNEARIGSTISKNCHCTDKDKKEAVLTFKDCGTQGSPFETPCIDGFTTIKLDNSFVKPIKKSPYSGGEIYAKPDMPFHIEGEGLIGNDMTIVYNGFTAPALGSPLLSMDNIPAGMTFKMLVGNPNAQHVIYETFKAGNYIYPAQTAANDELTLHNISITPSQNGTLSAQWNNIELEDGDQVPDNSELTLSVVPNEGYEGGTISVNGSEFTDEVYQVTGDVSFAVGDITAIPYVVNVDMLDNGNIYVSQEQGVTIGTNVELTITPDAGYRLKSGSLKVYELGNESKTVPVSDDSFAMPANNVVVTAEFEKIPYQITIPSMENGSITASPDTDVTEGVEVALTVSPASGYRLKEGSLKVYKTGDENTTVALSGNSFSMPGHDVTVTAEFEGIPVPPPPVPVYYTVNLPAIEGASTDPAPGDHQVESRDNFCFYLTLDKDYDKSEPVVTTDRGETITPRSSDGAYIVKSVRSDVSIFVDGVVKNPDPVANAEIESGTKVWVSDRQLFIRTDVPEDVMIYTFGGELRKAFRSKMGDEVVTLPAGRYIVCIGEKRFKIIL